MDIAKPISSAISSISFSALQSEDVRRISVKQVTNPVLFDNLNRPNAGGMYDPVFGPLDRGEVCATCRLSSFDCPGHYGHIELSTPVFHPLYMVQAYQLLRGTCTYCHHFLTTEVSIFRYAAKLSLLEHGLVVQADQVDALPMRVATKGKGSVDKSLEESGESTDEPEETIDQYKHRLDTWVSVCLQRAEEAGMGYGRDEYKKSGIVYDKRKRVIAEFIKSLTKKKCDRCGAYAHRLRKEGHTKLIEYSLVPKQAEFHKLSGIKRRNVLRVQANASRAADAMEVDEDEEVSEKEESGDEENVAPKKSNGKGKERAVESDDESEEEEEVVEVDDEESADEAAGPTKKRKQKERIISADEVRAHLRLLFLTETEIIPLLYAPHGPLATAKISGPSTSSRPTASADIFFMEVISVPPTRFRPAATMGDQVFENPQNSLLNAILRQTFTIRDLNRDLAAAQNVVVEINPQGVVTGKPPIDKTRLYTMLLESLVGLQVAVNSHIDSGKNPTIMRGGKLPPMGVKQMLEKKEGLFRMNMMGKRVNYAARSVISPDVNIETNEIGIPPVFARTLTFPEPVTEHNIAKLRQAVINGPSEHPGACFVQMEDGHLISLERMSKEERTAQGNKLLAPDSSAGTSRLDRPDYGLPKTRMPQINRKVYRHLEDGDIVILNRQPTLHKPSMMCHRVKVLNGEKTIRMHYANCNSYNADFDGDEMNIHFPQSLVAQAEARHIANTDNQYLVPTSGNPLRGLIQDHVVAGVWLTNKDTFFTREEYQQLIYGALRTEKNYTGGGMILTLPPTIIKPRPLWTGKQIISTLMLNITPAGAGGLNLTCKTKVPGSAWGIHKDEELVQFVDGELITGILDKAQIGASPFGLVHSVYEIYGPEVAGKLLSILSRVLTKFLQSRAFTCRMDDLLLNDKGNADRRAMLSKVNEKGLDAALDYVGLGSADKSLPETADDLRVRLEEVLRDDYKLAGLDATVEGETNQVTTGLIKTCLPSGLVKPFPHNNMQTMTVSGAKGSNVNASQISCLLGQQSLEGRRVPTMVSGKTLPSFKAFETAPRAGGFVAGRFLTGIRPQEYYFHCMAGREGLIDTAVKTSRSGYLQRCLIKHLEGLRVHYDGTVRNSDLSVLQFHYGEDSLDVTKQKHLMQFEFAVRNTASIVQRCKPNSLLAKVEQVGTAYSKKALRDPAQFAPELSISSPATHLGSVSEAYAAAIEKYVVDNPQRLLKTKKKHRVDWPKFVRTDELMGLDHFRSLMHMRYMRSLVEPGEAVGLLAAQGVGEPSTQMTLNTFHFAGHGAANVTLGIPRLREIVMTASQHIRTPTMQLPILESVTDAELQTFCQTSTRLTLSQIVDEVVVTEKLSSKTADNGYSRQKLYTIRLAFYPREDYVSEYNITAEQILAGIGKTFVPLLDKNIRNGRRQIEKQIQDEAGQLGAPKTVSEKVASRAVAAEADALEAEEAGVGRDDGEEEDGNADDARRNAQKDQTQTYESDEEDDADVDEAGMEAAFADEKSEAGESDMEELDPVATAKASRADSIEKMRTAERAISRNSFYVQSVRFDKEGGQYCEFDLEFAAADHKLLLVGVAEECCRLAIIHEIPGIARCFVSKPATKNAAAERMGMTEGVNLKACWNFGYGVVDLDRLYTNEIGETLKVYGVEAARTSIMKEISNVFGVYGIGVDGRHLTILADYMTNEGAYKPFNRTGLSNNTSTFLKASFETTSTFVAEAALFGDFDDLGTPSARIVLGQPPRSGTGAFGVLAAVEA